MLNVYDLDSSHKMYTRNVCMLQKGHDDLVVYEIGYHLVPADRRFVACRPGYVLHYVISGKGTFNGQPFGKGDCYLKVPYETEEVIPDADDPYETVWIIFYGKLIPKLLNNCGIEHKNCVFPFENADVCISLIRRALFEKKYVNEIDESYELHSLLFRILSKHVTPIKGKHDRGNDVAVYAAEYIEQNYSRPITVKNIAEYVHFSPNYLCSVFKNKYGMSLQNYMIDYRIKMAKDMMEKFENLSIGKIAENCGFKDALYFSRVFKNRVGIAPSEYKKRRIE